MGKKYLSRRDYRPYDSDTYPDTHYYYSDPQIAYEPPKQTLSPPAIRRDCTPYIPPTNSRVSTPSVVYYRRPISRRGRRPKPMPCRSHGLLSLCIVVIVNAV